MHGTEFSHGKQTRRHVHSRWMPLCTLLFTCVAVLLAVAPAAATGTSREGPDPDIAAMLDQIDESELRSTTHDLQNFATRAYGTDGNREAGVYLSTRLAAIPGLEVESGGGELNNIIATLPGSGAAPDEAVMVGAHYDSTSTDLARAPGATDNGCGVAIALELARVMSGRSFDRTVQFAFWNAEEIGRLGSIDYTAGAETSIVLYLNYDSSCYDPLNRSILDVIYDERSADIAALMVDCNTRYSTNFTLTENIHSCASDHVSFREQGYPAVATHCEEHGPAHTPDDTVDHISFRYAERNARFGLAVLAEVAGLRRESAITIQKAPMVVQTIPRMPDEAIRW